jgi:hypothetical protein
MTWKAIGRPSLVMNVDVTDRDGLQPAFLRVERELGEVDAGWTMGPTGPDRRYRGLSALARVPFRDGRDHSRRRGLLDQVNAERSSRQERRQPPRFQWVGPSQAGSNPRQV